MAEWVLRQRFASNEGEIAWDRFGDGPPVVMVHGTPWSSWTWRRVAAVLAERFSVYVFDLLGFGASAKRAGQDVSLAGHGARLAALLEFWKLDRPAGSPFYRLVREHNGVFKQLPAAIHEGVLRAYVSTAQPRLLDRDLENALIAPWLGRDGQSAFYRQIAQGDQRHTDEIEPLYAQITAPTLVIWGEADPWIPAARGAELARRIPGARLEILPTAGHLVQEDQPDELARLLRGHLDTAFN